MSQTPAWAHPKRGCYLEWAWVQATCSTQTPQLSTPMSGGRPRCRVSALRAPWTRPTPRPPTPSTLPTPLISVSQGSPLPLFSLHFYPPYTPLSKEGPPGAGELLSPNTVSLLLHIRVLRMLWEPQRCGLLPSLLPVPPEPPSLLPVLLSPPPSVPLLPAQANIFSSLLRISVQGAP